LDYDAIDVAINLAVVTVGFFAGRAAERRQYNLSASAFVSDYFRYLRAWASEGIDVLSEAAYCAPGRADHDEIDPSVCLRCRHRLSSLIDRGRFFIPNYNPDDVGTDKPVAFRGLRHPALDILVAAEQLLSAPELAKRRRFPSQRSALVEVKREFVSEIQELLDPRSQNKELAALLRTTRAVPTETRTALERLGQKDHPNFSEE
jgi:hypothetical protein